MLQQSTSKFSKFWSGQNVLVKIPDVDREHLALRNILAVVSSALCSILEKLYSRNKFHFLDITFGFIIIFEIFFLQTSQMNALTSLD